MIKIGILVGGVNYIKNIMEISNIFRNSELVNIKVIDPLATDIDYIINVSKEVDYIFIDRNLPMHVRAKIAFKTYNIACSLILFFPHKITKKFKFYSLSNKISEDIIINQVLNTSFKTSLRKIRNNNISKIDYYAYLLKENIRDLILL